MKRLFSSQQEIKISERYLLGESTAEIAKSLNTGPKVISGALRRQKISLRPSGKKPTIDHEVVFNLYRQGFSDNEIASNLCCSKGLVQSAIYKKKPEIRRDRSEAIKNSQRTKNRKWLNGKPNLKGHKNPRWKGGKTKLGHSIRADALYKEWRRAVFERDGYICQICGDMSSHMNQVILHADHINPLSKLIDRFEIKTIEQARTCIPLWDTKNGRTLCRPCHKKTPTYGINRHVK